MESFGLRTLTVGQLATNCYLVFDRKSQEGLIIDPGDSADYIMRVLADEKVRPLKILATHGHFDHLLAATELKLAFGIPLLSHKKDEFLVKNIQKSADYFLLEKQGAKRRHFLQSEPIDPPPSVDGFLKEGQKISFGRHKLEVLETPGHTPGSICFYLKEKC